MVFGFALFCSFLLLLFVSLILQIFFFFRCGNLWCTSSKSACGMRLVLFALYVVTVMCRFRTVVCYSNCSRALQQLQSAVAYSRPPWPVATALGHERLYFAKNHLLGVFWLTTRGRGGDTLLGRDDSKQRFRYRDHLVWPILVLSLIDNGGPRMYSRNGEQ